MSLENQREEYSVLEKKDVLNKIRKNPKLSAPKLRGIVKNTTRKTMCDQTIRSVLQKCGFQGRRLQKRPFVGRRNREDRV